MLSVFLVCLCVFYMASFVYFIFKNFKKLEEPEFKQKYLSFYDGLNTSTKWSACANLAWLIRAFVFILIVFNLRDFPKLQATLFFGLSSTMQLYVIIQQPYKKTEDNVLQVFNESGLIVLAVCLFFFTEMTYSLKSKITVGWSVITAVGVGIIINSIFVIMDSIKALKKKKPAPKMGKKGNETERGLRARGGFIHQPPGLGNDSRYNTNSRLKNNETDPGRDTIFGKTN